MPSSLSSSSAAAASSSSSSASTAQWTHRVEVQASQNMARNREMLECQTQLRHWKKRWNSTKQQFKQASLEASLRADPQRWNSLSKRAKWEKSHVLTVLQHHGDNLPLQLQEDSFATAAPAAIVNDKDIFLARIATQHCRLTYSFLGRRMWRSRNVPLSLIVPKTLQEDPDVCRRLLELHANYLAWQIMMQKDEANWIVPGSKLWNDPQLFVTFLKHFDNGVRHRNNGTTTTAEDAPRQMISRFSWSIRNDPDLVWEALRSRGCCSFSLLELLLSACRPTPQEIKEQQQQQKQQQAVSLPPLLKNNKEFALRLIAAQDLPHHLPENTLKWFSKRLRDDDQVVLAMVRRQGIALRHASFRLRRSKEIVLAAFEQHPGALVFAIANSAVRKALERQPDSMRRFFEAIEGPSTAAVPEDLCLPHSAYRRVWRRLSGQCQSDASVARAALLAGCVAASELPRSLRTRREFWLRTVQTSAMAWDALPEHWQNDVEFLRSLPTYPHKDLFVRVRTALANDREVWRKWLHTDSVVWDISLLEDAPSTIRHDKELMLLACSVDASVYTMLDSPLNEDRDILDAALQGSPEVLCNIPDWLQLQHPDLVAMAIREWVGDVWDVYDYVNEDLWSNPLVARAWASQGGDYLHEEFDVDMEDDKELFLLIAEHNPQDFWCASERLCKDKEFMMRVVGKNPTLLREAARSLGQDFSVALVAFGGGDDDDDAAVRSRDLAGSFDINDREEFEYITDFASKVRERLALHENFVTVVLCGMSARKTAREDCSNNTDCHFRALDQGSETSMAYRILLAEYMDIPIGRELRRLRRASVNLAAWGY